MLLGSADRLHFLVPLQGRESSAALILGAGDLAWALWKPARYDVVAARHVDDPPGATWSVASADPRSRSRHGRVNSYSPGHHPASARQRPGFLAPPGAQGDPPHHLERTVSLPPDHCHTLQLETRRLPGRLQLFLQPMSSFGRPRLPDTQVRRVARREPALRKPLLKSLL
jgi:hypothetical protein